jgi:hypothetical protein
VHKEKGTTMRPAQYLMALMLATTPALAEETENVLAHLDREVVLGAGKVEEPCFAMAISDRLQFAFEADSGLNFNIHYHENDSVSFPVSVKDRKKEEGEFFATGSRQYCMMWTNHTESDVKLTYRYTVSRRELSQ